MQPIATIHTDFTTKFGIPRQGRIVNEIEGLIVFNKGFRDPLEIEGIDQFSHLWLIWEFSENKESGWKPLVRPPRLGGNKKMGVFATRSPFRPNPIGLTCVQLQGVEYNKELGPLLHVTGPDMVDGTPIYDIKPYIPLYDSIPQATGGFTDTVERKYLEIEDTSDYLEILEPHKKRALSLILREDPRPSYQHDEKRIYGMQFAGYEVKFHVIGSRLVIDSIEKQ